MGPSKEKTIFREQPSQKIGFRLGLYDPLDEREEVEYVGRFFQDTPNDRAILEDVVRRFNQQSAGESGRYSCLGIFPVEL
jgi:hypothetical protein